MPYPIVRLEQMLHLWEDWYFLLRATGLLERGVGKPPGFPFAGPVIHAREFRQYLLGYRGEPFDHERFIGPSEIVDIVTSTGDNSFVAFPPALASWTAHSRRAFLVTEELQVLLDNTSLDGVTWADVSWPFPSFVVLPARPLVDGFGHRFDCVLVSHDRDQTQGERLWFNLFSDEFDRFRFLAPFERRQIEDAIRGARRLEQWRKAAKLIERARPKSSPWSSRFSLNNTFADRPVVGSALGLDRPSEAVSIVADRLVTYRNPSGIEQEAAARLVVGLCLYLASLPAGTPHRSSWQRGPQIAGFDRSAITDGAEICTVSSIYPLTPEERKLTGGAEKRSFHELRAHFRSGHWRRPPGLGSDPTAKKTVWVRPTMVRWDRLPDGAQPGGSESVVG